MNAALQFIVRSGSACVLLLSACSSGARAPAAAPRPPAPVTVPAVPPIDRTKPPEVANPAAVTLPTVQRYRLSNGLPVLIVERHDLPVVDVELVVRAGGAADLPVQAGRASLTADLLDEGTRTRNALQIADAIDFLGASLHIGSRWDASTIFLHVLSFRLDSALQVLGEIVVDPTFPVAEFNRVKDERLNELLQQLDEPGALAGSAFASVLYGTEHPYGATLLGNRASVRKLTRDAIVAFYRAYYRPNNAFLVAVGDVSASTLLPVLERTLGRWNAGPVPSLRLPNPPAAAPTTLYLVDKPGAAQTEIRIGLVGVPRSTPDYYPLLVANTILGGSFTSRLMQTIREEKGYAYGARSEFDMRTEAGPFVASAGVFTGVTDSAVVYFLKEIRELREQGVEPAELEDAKNFLIRGLPRALETTSQLAEFLVETELYGLSDDRLAEFATRVQAVTSEEVMRVTNEYIDAGHLAVVLVGDRAEIEPGLRALAIGPLKIREVK